MNPPTFSIVDFQIVSTVTVSSFSVSVTNVIVFNSATLNVCLFNTDNNLVNVFPLTLSGDDYTNWGGDDTYLYQYVANKMGYTLSSAVLPDISESV
jgi:hypothetical protein